MKNIRVVSVQFCFLTLHDEIVPVSSIGHTVFQLTIASKDRLAEPEQVLTEYRQLYRPCRA